MFHVQYSIMYFFLCIIKHKLRTNKREREKKEMKEERRKKERKFFCNANRKKTKQKTKQNKTEKINKYKLPKTEGKKTQHGSIQ